MAICTNDNAIIQPGGSIVSPMGKFADVSILVADSEPSAAMPLSVVSIMKNEFCAAMVKNVSIITPINAETIAAPRIALEKFLNK